MAKRAKRAKKATKTTKRAARKALRPRRSSARAKARSSRKAARTSQGASGASRKRSVKPKKRAAAKTGQAAAERASARVTATVSAKLPRLDRARRQLEDETIPTPPSSLNMNRHGSAARTGRAEIAETLRRHATMEPAITAGDVDASIENAYFSGDEAPGGDNSTPDQDVVDDIGRAVGVEYDDAEELKGSDKIAGRDKHRWELDPASAEDYRERK